MKNAHKGQFLKRKGYRVYHYEVVEDSRYGHVLLRRLDTPKTLLWEPVSKFVPAIKKKSELNFFDYIKGIPVIMLGMLARGLNNAGIEHYGKELMVTYYKWEYKLVGLRRIGEQ